MGVLETVLKFREMEQQRTNADIGAISTALQTFQKAMQQAKLFEFEKQKHAEAFKLGKLGQKVSLAKSGLRIDAEGNIVRDKALEVTEITPLEKLKARTALAKEGLRIDEEGNIIRDESLVSPLEHLLQQGQASDALLNLQEAQDAGLLGDMGGLKIPSTVTGEGKGVSLTQTMPETFDAKDSQFVITSIKAGTRTMENVGAKLKEKKTGKAVDVHFKEATEAVKGNRQFLRTVALFSGLVAQIKGKQEEQGGELGRGPGAKGAFMAKIRQPGYGRTAAFAGQRRETSFALNSILTGQNRVIRGVIHMILETLPDHFDPDDMVAAKITQSITNAYKLTMAFRKGLMSVEDIQNLSSDELKAQLREKVVLTSQEQEILDDIVNEILATPPTKPKALIRNFNSEAEAEAANLPKGTIVIINGRKARVD